MSSAVLIDVDFDSEEAWEAFALDHGIEHQTVYSAMAARNLLPDFYPAMEFSRNDNDDYLLYHYQMHQSNARLLGIPSIVDISTVDLNDRGEYYDWLQIHAAIHANEKISLGMVP